MNQARRREVLSLLCEGQKWKCYYCEGGMTRSKRFHQSPGYPSLERLVEGRDGGQYVEDNVVAACRSCNSSRPFLAPEEWKEVRRSLVLSRAWPACHAITRDVSGWLKTEFGYPTGLEKVMEEFNFTMDNPLTL